MEEESISDSSEMLLGLLPGHGAAFLGHGGTPGGGGGWEVGGSAGGGAADFLGGLVGGAGGGAWPAAGELTVDEPAPCTRSLKCSALNPIP